MNNEIEQLKREIGELKNWKQSLEAAHSIPLPIDQAFRKRFGVGLLKLSGRSADAEDVTVVTSVNFAGQTTNTTVVMDDPTGFLEITIDGTLCYIPYFI